MPAILSSASQFIASIPLTTRCFTVATLFFSILYQLLVRNDPMPYLILFPGNSLFYPWTFFTAGLVEVSILELIIQVVFVPASLRYLERLWGSLETLYFIAITITLSNFLSFIVSWAEFVILKNPIILYGVGYYGQMSLEAAILVAFTQLMPEHQIQIGMVRVRVKHLPMTYVTLSTIMVLVGMQSPWINIQWGWLVSWVYLRFYKKYKGDSIVGSPYGDRSETFAFVQWFPPAFHGPVGIVSNLVHKLATRLHLIPGVTPDLESGGYSQVPGGPRAEAERRRALALKALDQRMASSSAPRDSASQPVESGSRSSSVSPSTPASDSGRLHPHDRYKPVTEADIGVSNVDATGKGKGREE